MPRAKLPKVLVEELRKEIARRQKALPKLIAKRDGRREAISVDGPAALSVVFTAKRPVLIAERLAERLYLRDRSGDPLSTKAVIERVCG